MLGLECGGWLSRNVTRLLLGGEMVQVSIFSRKGAVVIFFVGGFRGSQWFSGLGLLPF